MDSVFNLGDPAEAWSNSFGVWGKGQIIRVDPNGKVAINFKLPDGQVYTKEFPAGHPDIRPLQVAGEPQAPPKAAPPSTSRQWSIGDPAKVWSRTKQTWGHGFVESIDADMIYVKFEMPEADGRMASYSKGLHRDNEDLQPGDTLTKASAVAMAMHKPIMTPSSGCRMSLPMAVPTPMQAMPMFTGAAVPGINSQGLSIGGRQRTGSIAGGIIVDELQVPTSTFDPTQPPLRPLLLSKLGLGQNTVLNFLPNCGGLNAGLWSVQDGAQALVLKLVKSQRIGPGQPTEAERLVGLSQAHPSLLNDPSVAFPSRIFRCVGMPGNVPHDLFVMRKAPGTRLTDVIPEKIALNRGAEVMQILNKLGSFLAEFHARYENKQHNDFQPANVMYEESTGRFTMVDVADIGNPQSANSDVEHFLGSLKVLSTGYGQQFLVDSTNHFRAGYGAARTPVAAPNLTMNVYLSPGR